MNRPEQQLHSVCVKYFRLQYPQVLAFHCPNGGARKKMQNKKGEWFSVEAKIFKGLGVVPGVADFLIFHIKMNSKEAYSSIAPYKALAIEFKAFKGTQSDYQLSFQMKWENWGGLYKVVTTFDGFKSIVDNYLNNQ